MEEARNLGGEAPVLVVDEGIEEAGPGVQGGDVVIGDGGGDEGAVTFFEQELFTCFADTDHTVALKT